MLPRDGETGQPGKEESVMEESVMEESVMEESVMEESVMHNFCSPKDHDVVYIRTHVYIFYVKHQDSRTLSRVIGKIYELAHCQLSTSLSTVSVCFFSQIFEWWYFKKYGTSFIEQVSLNHISPLLGGGETSNLETNSSSNTGQQQQPVTGTCHVTVTCHMYMSI